MGWAEQMRRDAVALAFPDWEWVDGDVAKFDADYEAGWSDVTPGQGFTIDVSVCRGEVQHNRGYDGSRAAKFFQELMQRGSR